MSRNQKKKIAISPTEHNGQRRLPSRRPPPEPRRAVAPDRLRGLPFWPPSRLITSERTIGSRRHSRPPDWPLLLPGMGQGPSSYATGSQPAICRRAEKHFSYWATNSRQAARPEVGGQGPRRRFFIIFESKNDPKNYH